MEPNTSKSFLKAFTAEIVILIGLIIVVVIAFNYFGMISLPISFLPQQQPQVNTNTGISANTSSPQVRASRGARIRPLVTIIPITPSGEEGHCQYLPSFVNAQITPPAEAVPSPVAKFSGVWEGVWSGGAPADLIVSNITPTQVTAYYVFNGKAQTAKYNITAENALQSANQNVTWEINANGISGTLGKERKFGTIQMRKCLP